MSLVLKINFGGVNDISGLTFWTTFKQIILRFALSDLVSKPEHCLLAKLILLLRSTMARSMAFCGNLGIYIEIEADSISKL